MESDIHTVDDDLREIHDDLQRKIAMGLNAWSRLDLMIPTQREYAEQVTKEYVVELALFDDSAKSR